MHMDQGLPLCNSGQHADCFRCLVSIVTAELTVLHDSRVGAGPRPQIAPSANGR